MFILFVTIVLACLAAQASAFDWTMGNLTLWHSQSTYCSPSTYMTRTYKGLLSGFVPTYAINDSAHDTHGYIGYNTAQQAIYVAFRGSESIQNWISDLDAILTTYPLCSNCEVHKGFYTAEQASYANILSQVKSLRSKYPTYQVVVTGHSLGAALATLTSIDLIHSGISNVRMFNYGSPRVGNTAFANYYQTIVGDRNRVTHHKVSLNFVLFCAFLCEPNALSSYFLLLSD